jgi:hypothetical protein
MVTNWSMSKDEIYGPPPAYSLNPPPSIYVVPETRIEYQERPSSSHASIVLSTEFRRYLLGTGLLHIFIGIIAIVCDILLISMNQSYLFPGLWAGVLCIILGIYLILFMSDSIKQKCSLQRFQFVHITICVIIIIALILSSMNLLSNSCSAMFFEQDQCQPSAQKLKIVLVTFFAFTFLQICTNFIVTFVHTR